MVRASRQLCLIVMFFLALIVGGCGDSEVPSAAVVPTSEAPAPGAEPVLSEEGP